MDTGGPAFARPVATGSYDDGYFSSDQEGMTLQDYFAAKALQGLLADPLSRPNPGETIKAFRQRTADVAYGYADAMLIARGKGK